MIFPTLQGSNPCAPPNCCPPKKRVGDVYIQEYNEITKTRHFLEYCGFSNGVNLGPAFSFNHQGNWCRYTQPLGTIRIGDTGPFPDKPPKGRWIGQKFEIHTHLPDRIKGCIPPGIACDGVVISEKNVFIERLYEYCE
ncbi:MAG: hypothetical protein RML49_03565 [Verrucomicrobiae bacterium]|nr:hypothetical protein [Verrucomicrobiae bacterium]